jgi:anti-anti-sigma regulatory factor
MASSGGSQHAENGEPEPGSSSRNSSTSKSSTKNPPARKSPARKSSARKSSAKKKLQGAPMPVMRLADCPSAEEFRVEALRSIPAGEVTLDLESVDHLDAGTLQVLLAVSAEQTRHDRPLPLVHLSPALRHWLEWTGAAQHLTLSEERSKDG